MTRCNNCGHTGRFVLLAQFALAVPASDAADADRPSPDRDERPPGECSLAVQCPACDSTDVAADDLLAGYGTTTRS